MAENSPIEATLVVTEAADALNGSISNVAPVIVREANCFMVETHDRLGVLVKKNAPVRDQEAYCYLFEPSDIFNATANQGDQPISYTEAAFYVKEADDVFQAEIQQVIEAGPIEAIFSVMESPDTFSAQVTNGEEQTDRTGSMDAVELGDAMSASGTAGSSPASSAGSGDMIESSDLMSGGALNGDQGSFTTGIFRAAAPMPTLSGSGAVGGVIRAAFPMPSLTAYGSGFIRMRAPMPTMSAVGELPASGSFVASFPMPKLSATGDIPALMSFAATAPMPTMVAYGGGTIRARAPMPTMSASGFIAAVGTISAVAPMPTMSASGEVPQFGTFVAAFPMPVIAGTGEAAFVVPMPRLLASGTNGAAVAYQTFAINLQHKVDQAPQPVFVNEVTAYAGFANARQIVRHGDKHFVITDDAIYEHAGSTDNGQPISWEMQTAYSDLGSRNLKQIRYMYIGGRLGGGYTGQIIPGDDDPQSHANTNDRSQKPQNGRVLGGRGTRSRYYGFGLANAMGERIDVDAIDIEFDVTGRGK